MTRFPTICMDNFYNNPDAVREWALKQEFLDSPGNYPGKRTKELWEIDPKFFDIFGNKIFSLLYPNQNVRWRIQTTFWKVTTQDSDPLCPKNMGWIHTDNCIFAGVIYLTPNFDRKLGTTIYKQVKFDEININHKSMHSFYRDRIDNEFDDNIIKNNSMYEETITVENIYNRMICFDGQIPHSPSGYYMKDSIRLSQVFFVSELNTDCSSPNERVRDIENDYFS